VKGGGDFLPYGRARLWGGHSLFGVEDSSLPSMGRTLLKRNRFKGGYVQEGHVATQGKKKRNRIWLARDMVKKSRTDFYPGGKGGGRKGRSRQEEKENKNKRM